MSESEFNELRELSWRRPLNAIEEARLQAYLAMHPEQRAAWEEELGLTQTLNQLPQMPVSSNFTSLVLQELDQAERKATRWGRWWPGWLQRRLRSLAWGTALALMLVVGFTGYQVHQEHQQLKQGAGLIAAAIPEPDALANFETIQKLGPLPSVDEELWLALNE